MATSRTVPLLPLGIAALALGAAACHKSNPPPAPGRATPLSTACTPSPDFVMPSIERAPGGVPEVDLAFLAAHHCQVRVVDVREPQEVAAGRLPFGEHIPLAQVGAAAARWDPDEPVLLVCRSGRRSARAALTLEKMGFSHAASVNGGVLAWERAGGPVVRGDASPPAPSPPPPASPRDGPLGKVDVQEHLGDQAQTTWMKAAALLLHGSESCVDGRDARRVVGTPGGDAGELLLALAALEHVRGTELGAEDIDALFDAYLDAFGRFYMHTDEHAVAPLAQDPRYAPWIEDVGMPRFLRHPPRTLEPALLDDLSRSDHVGCGHLRLILEHPDEYEVRPALARSTIQAAIQRWWQGGPIDFVILEGDHHEGAVVNVRLGHEVHAFSRVPTVAPRIGSRAMFVNHPEVAAWLRQENAAFLFEVVPALRDRPASQQAYADTLARLGQVQLRATLTHLAAHLPVFDAVYTADGVRVARAEMPRVAQRPVRD